MSRSPRVTGTDLIAALGRAGFVIARIRGSHHKILRDCQMSAEDISKLLRRE
jgi:predicted RNA binding protein YcfA (HicA-like mRNA interferase family)